MLNACRRQRSVHGAPCSFFCSSCCAQRLSASKIGSPNRRSQFQGHPGVLNACRRQRSVHQAGGVDYRQGQGCSTPVGVKDRFTVMVHTFLSCCVCAQRLSASKIGSRAQAGERQTWERVLNACRRQRSVHISSCNHRNQWSIVLNACRRQRSVHHPSRPWYSR